MFDSHCHLNFKAFADDTHAVANAMERNRVRGLVVGCDSKTSRYAIDLAQTLPNLWASVGLHPIHVLDDPWDNLLMKELALEDRVVAVGEVGLDFYRTPENKNQHKEYIDTQYKTFRNAIDLAKSLDKPLVVHSRQAYDEIIEVLTKSFSPVISTLSTSLETGSKAKGHTEKSIDRSLGFARDDKLHGTVHCFMGNWQQAKKLLDLGFMLGFTGVITYKEVADSLIEVIKEIPLDRLLIETDAPYLTPEPYRSEGKKNSGKIPRNLPQYALEVAKKIAEVKKMKTMEIVKISEDNANRLFSLK